MMLSSDHNHAALNSPGGEGGGNGADSHCEEESGSPSSLSHFSAHEMNIHNSLRDDNASSSPSSLANISSNIEIHPQNDALGGSSTHKFIKRPLNAYMIWTRQERKRILTDDPKMKMNEVSKAMGEKWKKMTDKEKKPYFELAKKFSEEHKMALQEHPELQYAPSKKKGPPKKPDGKFQQSVADSASVKSCTITPDASRSTTPRMAANLVTPQQISQSQVFSPFQAQLASSTVQLAQVLQGVRSVTSQPGVMNPSVQNSFLGTAPTFPQSLLQSQQFSQRVSNPSLLGGLSTSTNSTTSAPLRTTPGQMLDLYYTSLCQPAFPNITENPVNPLGVYPPHYLLEQYNQQLSQQQQGNGNSSGATNSNGGGQF